MKKLITNSRSIARLLFAKLSKGTTTADHFGNESNFFFSSESSNFNKVTLVGKYLILEKNEDIAETINRIPLLIVIKLMTELGTRL